jgi:hypothetical protein
MFSKYLKSYISRRNGQPCRLVVPSTLTSSAVASAQVENSTLKTQHSTLSEPGYKSNKFFILINPGVKISQQPGDPAVLSRESINFTARSTL